MSRALHPSWHCQWKFPVSPFFLLNLTFSRWMASSFFKFQSWNYMQTFCCFLIVCFIDTMLLGSSDCLELCMQSKLGSFLEACCLSFHAENKGVVLSCSAHILYWETILFTEWTWLSSRKYLDHSETFFSFFHLIHKFFCQRLQFCFKYNTLIF